MLKDATGLGLVSLGPGAVWIVDELGSLWVHTFGDFVGWANPAPELQTYLVLDAVPFPRGKPYPGKRVL